MICPSVNEAQHQRNINDFTVKSLPAYKAIPTKCHLSYHIIFEIDIDICLVFNATISNISAISWWSVLVVEEAGVPGENHRPWASNW
jgi:hypothetical protein